MWSVEELSIQHQSQKVTVLNVKKFASPTGRTDGLGLLYMGYQSVFLGRRFKQSITQPSITSHIDDEVDESPPENADLYKNVGALCSELCTPTELQTILDTGNIKLMQPNIDMSDHQVQTDLTMPIWVFNNIDQSILNPQIDGALSQVDKEVGVSGTNSRTILTKSDHIDVNSCEQFSVVHYENLSQPKSNSMVMVETQSKNQKSVCMLDVNKQGTSIARSTSPVQLQLENKSIDKKQLHLTLNSVEKEKHIKRKRNPKPVSSHNKHGYTSQYEALDEQNLSYQNSSSSSSCQNSPVTTEDSSPCSEITSTSSIDLSSSTSTNCSPMHFSNIVASHSIDSDLVSLLSSPDDGQKRMLSSDGEVSIWDTLQHCKTGDLTPEENTHSDMSLITDIQELTTDSVNMPLNSMNDKPAVLYKAYKVDPSTKDVVLSKAKIATYLPLMKPAILDSKETDQLFLEATTEGDEQLHRSESETPLKPNLDEEGYNLCDDVVNGTNKLDTQVGSLSSQMMKNTIKSENESSTLLSEEKLNEIEESYVPMLHENGNNSPTVFQPTGDNSISIGSASDTSAQTYSGETCTDQQSTTGDETETDICLDTEQSIINENTIINNSLQNSDESSNSFEIRGKTSGDKNYSSLERYNSNESLTIYLKTEGSKVIRSGNIRDASLSLSNTPHFSSINDKGKKKAGVISKTFAGSKKPVGLGLNQLQTVVSRTSKRNSPKHEIGLNQLSSGSPVLQRKPQFQVSLLSPGGSTTSEDDFSPYRRQGGTPSTETSSGAYLMASYDDGSDWGDDSLLWNTDSVESLNSSMSDSAYETIMDCEVHPNWMADLPTRLHEVPIVGLVIPGSHISFAIERDLRTDMDISKCNYEMAEFLRKLPNLSIFNCFRSMIKKIWKNWMGKQMLTVSQQLYAGIRYLDLRITKYRSALFAEHGLYSQQLPKYLKEIKMFSETHSREVIILHFGALNQIDQKDKRKLVTMLFQVFGARLAKCPNNLNEITLQSLWNRKKQIIVIFPEADLKLLHNHIFAGLIWPDTYVQTRQSEAHVVTELIDFLDNVYHKDLCIAQTKRKMFHVTRAVLSPDMSLVFGEYQFNSMREMTLEDTHPAVYNWIKEKPNLNIVALDFVGKGDMIEKIICLNHAKFCVTTTV